MSTPFEVTGNGPHTVLCLHGWFGSSRAWGAFPRFVDTEAFRYVFVDYRGYGARKDVAGEYTLAEISADVLALADELGVDSFSLIGHSMGGSAILRILADAPERVRKLVGVAPVGARPTPFDADGHDLFYGAPDDREKRYGIVDFTTGNRNTPVWVTKVVEHSLENSTLESFTGHLHAWATPDFEDEVRGNSTPTLVVVGEHDPALGRATAEQTWTPLLPNCRIADVANAGHYPMEEAPVNFATVVEQFLRD